MLKSDPLKIAADEMVQAAEKYRAAVWQLGAEVGVTNPYRTDLEPSTLPPLP